MHNLDQTPSPIAKRRYSIPQLLELSSGAGRSFDLSKFSYEAARAGVVPQLGACAITSRKTSNVQPFDGAGQSASTSEDVEMHNAPEMPLPVRSPTLPPAGLRAQEDQGFARFLKKHASPTHQRVTAGGRIVPIESRPSPPVFNLRNRNRDNVDDWRGPVNLRPSGLLQASNSAFDQGAWRQQNMLQGMPSPVTHTLNDYPMAANTGPTGRQTFPDPPTSNVKFGSGYTLPHEPWSQYADRSVAVAHVGDPGSGYSTHTNALSPRLPVSSLLVHNAEEPLLNPRLDNQYLDHDMIAQQSRAATQSLAYWSQCYGELDQQLKTLDRHRAMTSLNVDMAQQRRAIVQQRSDTKDIIKKIASFLRLSDQAFAGYGQGRLNVNAPVYVPQQLHNAHHTAAPGAEWQQVNNTGILDCIQPPGARRPIPIIAPSSPEAEPEVNNVQVTDLTSDEELDPWGVRIGMAPPELQRLQNETVKNMIANKLIPSPGHYPVPRRESRPDGPVAFRSFSENDAFRSSSEDSSSDLGTWSRVKHGRAPPVVEGDYAKQLDALRKPKGTITVVHLHDGSAVSLEGSNPGPPPAHAMTDFERTYWSGIPNQVHHATSSGSNESTQATHHIKTPASLSCSLSHGFVLSPAGMLMKPAGTLLDSFQEVGHDATGGSQSKRAQYSLTDAFGTLKMPQPTRRVVPPPQLLLAPQGLPTTTHVQASHIPHRPYRGYTDDDEVKDSFSGRNLGGQPFAVDPMPRGAVWEDNMSNKGYSSVSVQNVHAVTDHFPYLDGPSEQGRRVESLLGHATKPKSPRVLQHGGGTGSGAWFGPFRRGMGAPAPPHHQSSDASPSARR